MYRYRRVDSEGCRVGEADLLGKTFRLDQMQVEYSQLPSFFMDLARLVDDFRQQNCQLRDQVEAADHSSWHVAEPIIRLS